MGLTTSICLTMASASESTGCFAKLFGGGEKKSITVDLAKNAASRGGLTRVQSVGLSKGFTLSIRNSLHFASLHALVSKNGGQPVYISVTGVTGSIQCAPAPAAGVDHVAVEAAAAVAAEECTIAVDVHQEERGGAGVEVEPAAEVVADGGVDVVPEATAEVVPGESEVAGEEEIVVCDDNQELFSEPPMFLDEEVIQVDEVVAVEQEPEL